MFLVNFIHLCVPGLPLHVTLIDVSFLASKDHCVLPCVQIGVSASVVVGVHAFLAVHRCSCIADFLPHLVHIEYGSHGYHRFRHYLVQSFRHLAQAAVEVVA